MSGRQDNRLDEDLRRERDEPGTTAQEGNGDAGRAPQDAAKQRSATEDKLGARKTGHETEDEDAGGRSEFTPSGK